MAGWGGGVVGVREGVKRRGRDSKNSERESNKGMKGNNENERKKQTTNKNGVREVHEASYKKA